MSKRKIKCISINNNQNRYCFLFFFFSRKEKLWTVRRGFERTKFGGGGHHRHDEVIDESRKGGEIFVRRCDRCDRPAELSRASKTQRKWSKGDEWFVERARIRKDSIDSKKNFLIWRKIHRSTTRFGIILL